MSIDAYLALHQALSRRLPLRIVYPLMVLPGALLRARTWARYYLDLRPWC